MCIRDRSKGEPLLYFDSYEALKFFFVQSLKWEDEEDSLLPDLKEFGNFVVFANPKGLLIGPDAVSYTHLTLPTKRIVDISVGAASFKKKKNKHRMTQNKR